VRPPYTVLSRTGILRGRPVAHPTRGEMKSICPTSEFVKGEPGCTVDQWRPLSPVTCSVPSVMTHPWFTSAKLEPEYEFETLRELVSGVV